MPNPNAIVSRTIRFDPPLDRAPAEALRAERGLSVGLEGDRRIRLDPDDRRSVGFVRVLDTLAKRRKPVYLEIDPATNTISRLRIPMVAWVTEIRSGTEGTLEIRLHPSHARHALPLGEEDSAALERELRGALERRRPVLVVEDDRNRIIDVREITPDPEAPLPPFPEPGVPPRLPPQPWPRPWRWVQIPIEIVIRWLLLPWRWFTCPTLVTAQQIFDEMAATSCDPLTVPPPCIPFLFPENGCWARAHEMARLMIEKGYSPRKVWIDGILHVETANSPNCFVDWGWHVAPILCVRVNAIKTEMMVIDPSLFTTPVTEKDWKHEQGDPKATLTESDASQFWPWGGTDPTYSQTNDFLDDYRLDLYNRANHLGPPPYACP
jgi:hypothetical protein